MMTAPAMRTRAPLTIPSARKPIVLFAFAAVAALPLGACGPTGEPAPDGASSSPGVSIEGVPEEHLSAPIAVVNGVTIYEATYDEMLDIVRQQIPEDDPDKVERFLAARMKALEKAIDEELLFQEAVRRGYDPPAGHVMQLFTERAQTAGSEGKLLAEGRRRRHSKSEILYACRRQLALERFVKAEVEASLTAIDDEVRAFYETRPELFTPDPWVRVGQIFVEAPRSWPQERRAAALTKLGQALEKLHQGRSFESLAREYSEDQAGPEGGSLGYFKRGNLPDALDRAAFALKPGQVSDIVEGEDGYHLLKVYEIKGGRLEPFDKVRDDARQRLLSKKRADALNAILSRLKGPAQIERFLA